MKKNKSETPRSTRYTTKQMEYFQMLESIEINVSEWIRSAVKEKMEREIDTMKETLKGPNQTLAGINTNLLYEIGELPR